MDKILNKTKIIAVKSANLLKARKQIKTRFGGGKSQRMTSEL